MPKPLADVRQDLVMRELRRAGSVRVADLSAQLGVSPMTIRRDIDALAATGRAIRIHGGARLPEREGAVPSTEQSFETKAVRQQAEKTAIARAAAATIAPGSAIALTGGTTTAALGICLEAVGDLVLITNSLPVAEQLQRHPGRNHTVVLTGGQPTPSAALVGPMAERSLDVMHIDQVFMGVHGMTEEAGFTSPNIMEARTNQAFMKAGARTTVLADCTKWGTVGLSSIAALTDVDTVITDTGLHQQDENAYDVLTARVPNVVLVDVGPTSRQTP